MMPKLPRLRLSYHAQMRLVERDIDIDNVKKAITEPDSRQADPYGKTKVQKRVGDRTIVVIYSEQRFRNGGIRCLIITFYYLDK